MELPFCLSLFIVVVSVQIHFSLVVDVCISIGQHAIAFTKEIVFVIISFNLRTVDLKTIRPDDFPNTISGVEI
jgi:hypothetical protein